MVLYFKHSLWSCIYVFLMVLYLCILYGLVFLHSLWSCISVFFMVLYFKKTHRLEVAGSYISIIHLNLKHCFTNYFRHCWVRENQLSDVLDSHLCFKHEYRSINHFRCIGSNHMYTY